MAYRNGTYIAFHANGYTQPAESDMKYYNLLKAWHANSDIDFQFVNSHDKTAAVRDSSTRETLKRALRERLNNSKNMVLIIGRTTREDRDWVPFEIEFAIDSCSIPIIATYTDYNAVHYPQQLRHLWPDALAARIDSGRARVIHVPFKREPLLDAIPRFSHTNYPSDSLTIYTLDAYRQWGLA